MGIIVRFSQPDGDTTWTHSRIYRAASETGSYSQVGSDIASGTYYYYDVSGTTSNWYEVSYYDSGNTVESSKTDPMQGGDYRGYTTVEELRKFTGATTIELDNNSIQAMIDQATEEIDKRTGRTWQGIASQSNEYYDGNGEREMKLQRGDIQSITTLQIDDDDDDIFDTISSSSPVWYDWYDNGRIILNASSSPSVFPDGIKNVRVSYTYGNTSPSQDVKHLTLLMVADMLNTEERRTALIERKIRELKAIGADIV